MEYKGNIGIDMTGGDIVNGKIFLERAIKYTKIVLKKHPEYLFFLAGSADILNQVGLPGRPGNKRIVNAKEDSLTTLLNMVDKNSLDAIVTHEGAKKLQKSLAKARAFKRIPGFRRSALAAIVPTNVKNRYVVTLDVGANSENTNEQLVQYAHLGTIIARELFKKQNPTVAKMNMCEEPDRGPLQYQELYKILEKEKGINFIGFMEDRHIVGLVDHFYQGKNTGIPDVVIGDGYEGNRFIKGLEAGCLVTKSTLKQEMSTIHVLGISHLINTIRGLSFLTVTKRVAKRLKPSQFGGALLSGIRTRKGNDIIMIKGHGEADEDILHGIERAIDYHNRSIVEQINCELQLTLAGNPTIPDPTYFRDLYPPTDLKKRIKSTERQEQ